MPESRHKTLLTKKATAALEDGAESVSPAAQVPFRLLYPPRDFKAGKESLPGAAGACRELSRGGPQRATNWCWWCPAPQGVPQTDAPASTPPACTYVGEGACTPLHQRLKSHLGLRKRQAKQERNADRAAKAAASHADTAYRSRPGLKQPQLLRAAAGQGKACTVTSPWHVSRSTRPAPASAAEDDFEQKQQGKTH